MSNQVTFHTCDGDQSVQLEFVPEMDGVLMALSEIDSDRTFRLYMSRQESNIIGKNLIDMAKIL